MATEIKDDTTLDFGPPQEVGNKTDVNSSLDKFMADTDGDTVDVEATTETAATNAETGAKAEPVAKDSSSEPVDSGKQQPNKGQEKAPVAGANDLTLQDGTIIRAGAERRMFDQLRVERERGAALDNTVNQVRANYERVKSELATTREAIERITGTSPEDTASAVTLYKSIKTDPSGTLRTLLTEARAAGIVIDANAPANPTDDIVRQIEARLAPLLAPLQQQHQERNGMDDAAKEVNGFYSAYPDARLHDSTIAAVIEANPDVSLQQAYFQLKSAFAARGLDWTKPLAQQAPPASSEQQKQAPLNGGRTVVNPVPANRVPIAADTASTADIIKEAMREAGLSV